MDKSLCWHCAHRQVCWIYHESAKIDGSWNTVVHLTIDECTQYLNEQEPYRACHLDCKHFTDGKCSRTGHELYDCGAYIRRKDT